VALETTGLVPEAFLRLAGTRHPRYENRLHFYGIASRLMRQILVEMARARNADNIPSLTTDASIPYADRQLFPSVAPDGSLVAADRSRRRSPRCRATTTAWDCRFKSAPET